MNTQTTEPTVADLTVAELRELIRETVLGVISELIEDPDEGLELSDWAVARLKAAEEAANGEDRQTVPLAEAAGRLGVSD